MLKKLFLLTIISILAWTMLVACSEERPEEPIAQPEPTEEEDPMIVQKDFEDEVEVGPMDMTILTGASATGDFAQYVVKFDGIGFNIFTATGSTVNNIELNENTQLQLILMNESSADYEFVIDISGEPIQQLVPANEDNGIIVEIPVHYAGDYTFSTVEGTASGSISASGL